MSPVLTLLDGVRWRDKPVVGERAQALLAALASGAGRAVPEAVLIESVWGSEVGDKSPKALHVLVSRTRALYGADVAVRERDGYRLGIGPEDVDSVLLASLADGAGTALVTDPASALDEAGRALALAGHVDAPGERVGIRSIDVRDGGRAGILDELRRTAAAHVRTARLVAARARSRLGDHAAAYPALEAALLDDPGNEAVLADLLHSEADVAGPAAALRRYELYRSQVSRRLGASPGEALQRAHREILALDNPVRSGVQYDATRLLGRERDVARLQAMVRTSRVTSIVGAGGLGKTRLAHVLARDAHQPVVHVVELAGITAPEDLVGEVGSVLGVRDSVGGRNDLTPAQRADVRSRIAQQLGRAPTLLVLDNCEHIVAAVADLVALLVATTRDLCVLTTSRAPLAIAAEQVYALGELGADDSAELFRERAVAARPTVHLTDAAVDAVVARLDGLPLAIELAAAKVRAMSVEDIGRRLSDRFALLRGGERGGPDRHQTLLAVIDWSWNLLGPTERHALCRLSVFHDGFTLEAAGVVLAEDALDAVQSLVDQSLLKVVETGSGVRYRLLETVRDFGRMHLVEAGEGGAEGPAAAALRSWATSYAVHHGSRVFGPDQFGAIDALAQEEVNLHDVVRQALIDGDPATVAQVVGHLGLFWYIRGDHTRVLGISAAVLEILAGWRPTPELVDVTRLALIVALNGSFILSHLGDAGGFELLRTLGPGKAEPVVVAMTRLLLDTAGGDHSPAHFEEIAAGGDRHLSTLALQSAARAWENDGDPARALDLVERALRLTRPEDGPWFAAILHAEAAQLLMQVGRRVGVGAHAAAALPVLERLGGMDDVVGLRYLLALAALGDGRLADAAAEIARAEEIDVAGVSFAGTVWADRTRAELAFARGDLVAGMAANRSSLVRLGTLALPGLTREQDEPWAIFGEASVLAALARHGAPEDEPEGARLSATLLERLLRVVTKDNPELDYPVAGGTLLALGAWGLRSGSMPPTDAAALLALAERFGYNRSMPTMAWEPVAALAEEIAPGAIAAAWVRYGDRRGPGVRDEARSLIEKVAAL